MTRTSPSARPSARLAGVRAVTRPACAWVAYHWFVVACVYLLGFTLLNYLPRAMRTVEQLSSLGSPSAVRSKLHLALAIACVLYAVYILIRWLSTRYELSPRAMRLSSGVIRRQHITIQPNRMQDVVARQSVFERVFGLGTISVTTASGRGARLRSIDPWQRVERTLRTMMQPEQSHAGSVAMPTSPQSTNPTPAIIGIAGGIGSGKSHVARVFATLGCDVSDSDAQTRALLAQPDTIATLSSWWGEKVLNADGSINRPAVASIVFNDPSQRTKLEQHIHPQLHAARAQLIAQSTAPAIIIDAPLLFEAGVDTECDAVVFVECPREIRLARATASRGWTEDELDQRERTQMPLKEKRARSLHIIENTDTTTKAELRARAQNVLSTVLVSQRSKKSGTEKRNELPR